LIWFSGQTALTALVFRKEKVLVIMLLVMLLLFCKVVYSWQTYWRHFKISRTKKIRFHFWSIKQKKKVHWCKKIAIRNVKFRFFWETQKKKKKSSPRFISAFYFRLSCEKFEAGVTFDNSFFDNSNYLTSTRFWFSSTLN